MNTQHRLEACRHHLLLEAGISTVESVVSWADSYISSVGYHDAVADIAIGAGSEKDVLAGLGRISATVDRWDALRAASSTLAGHLESKPNSTEMITRLLEEVWISSSYDEPEDFYFVVGCHDDFCLIRDGLYGSVTRFRRGLVKALRNVSN